MLKKIRYAMNPPRCFAIAQLRTHDRLKFYDLVKFEDKDLFTNENGTKGRTESTNYNEINYKLTRSDTEGRVQVCVSPLKEEDLWIVTLHDVTVEDKLHTKYHNEIRSKELLVPMEWKRTEARTRTLQQNLETVIEGRKS
ncbi:MAG: hypothetical protein R2827_06475 [Bdellovibrionales bacterium]